MPDSDAAARLVAHIADKVYRREVITIEFLFERTLLLADINGAADARHAQPVVETSRYRDRQCAPLGARPIGVVERCIAHLWRGPFVNIEMRCVDPADPDAPAKSECFGETGTIGRCRTRVDRHIVIGGHRDFLQNQRDCWSEPSRRVCRPNIDAGGPLAGFREQHRIGIRGVEHVGREVGKALFRQEQHRDKPFGPRNGRPL